MLPSHHEELAAPAEIPASPPSPVADPNPTTLQPAAAGNARPD